LALLKSEYFEALKEYTEAFVSSEGLHILYAMETGFEDAKDFDTDKLRQSLDDNSADYIDALIKEIKIGADDRKAFLDCKAKLDKMRVEKRKKEIREILELVDGEGQSEYQQKLMEEYMQLQSKK
ncbi:MAG: hypothetical protein IKZ78_04630, partial [Firmicutes bacterium]|nr:hypothetical protein [Bacillota bacterium]